MTVFIYNYTDYSIYTDPKYVGSPGIEYIIKFQYNPNQSPQFW